MATGVVFVRRLRNRVGVIAFIAVGLAASVLGGGASHAVGGPTWWKVDTHEHSSFSGDGRQDLALLAANDKTLNYNAIFVTDHDRGASFAISGANGNYLNFRDAIVGTRWDTHEREFGPPTSFTHAVVASPVHSGTGSLHLAVTAGSTNAGTVRFANRGASLRGGDVTLDFWVNPATISANSGVDVSVSLGGDQVTGQTPFGYTTSNGVANIGKSTVLVWQLGSARAASTGTTHVITNPLSYTLNTWNHYVINVTTGAVAWTPSGGSTTNTSSSGLSSLTAADAPATDVVLANVTMEAAATNGTADAFFDDYTLSSANQNCPAADFAYRNGLIDSGVYDNSTFKLFPAREMGQTFHTNQFNFDFTGANQYYDVFADPAPLANDATLCAATNNPSAPWKFAEHGVDNIPAVQASGYPAQDNHPDVTDSIANVIATQAHGADAVEEENSVDYSTTWDAILQQNHPIMGTWGTDSHEKVGNGAEANYIDAPALTLDDLMRSYFEGRMFGAPNNFGGHLVFNPDATDLRPYPARYPVYVPSTQATANVHLSIDGGLVAGETVNWYYNSGSGNTTITDPVGGATYGATKAIPLTGAFTYVRADVRSSTGTLVATTQPIFFEDVTGLPADKSYHVDSVRAASGCGCSVAVTKGITGTSFASGSSQLSITLTNPSGSTVKLLGTAAAAPTLVKVDSVTITQSASLAAFDSATGNAWFYDSPTQTLYLQDLQASGSSLVVVTFGGAPDTTAPTIPTNVQATAVGSSQIDVTWNPSTDLNGVAGYHVFRDGGGSPFATVLSGTSYQDMGLAASSTHTYRVSAFDPTPNESAQSSPPAQATTSAGGPIALVQQKQNSGTAASLPVTISPASGAGHALVATIALAAGSSATVLNVTDSASGTWTKGPVGFLSGTNSRVEIWYRLNASSVTSVTVTLSTSKALAVSVSEWSGVAATSAFDRSAGGSGASSTTVTTPSLATTNAADLVIGAVNYPANVTSTLGAGSFTGLTNFNSSTTVHGRAAYAVTSATGSFQASWSLTAASGGNGGAILALKGDAGGGGSPPPAPALVLSESDATDYSIGTQVYYRQGASGSFNVTATSTGATAVQFPVVFGSDSANDTSSPFSQTYNWTSGASTSGPFLVTATNASGTSPSSEFTVTPDAAAPSTATLCNGVACAGPYSSPVTVSLFPSDAGSGVASTYYTLDGSAPTTGSPVYSGPFVLSGTTTVRFFSVDNVGNTETAGSLTVTITGGGGGAIALVHQTPGGGSAATLPVTISPASGTGHALVATIALAAGSSATVLNVTDSAIGTWIKGPVGFLSGANSRVEIWYRLNASSVTSVTVTLSTAKSAAVNVTEWSGVATASAVDGSLGGSGATSTTVTTPSLATTNATDLVIGAVNYPAGVSSTLGSGSFTGLSDFSFSSSVHGRAAYQITSATGSFQASWTLAGASGGNGGAIIAFKSAGGGGGNTPPTANPVSLNATTAVSTPWTPSVSDPDVGDTLSCSIVSQPANGTATVNSNCSGGTYQSNAAFTGSDPFTYRVFDGTVFSPNATVTVTVSGGGSPPPAPTLTLTETDGTDFVSGSTVFYRQGAVAGGSFTVGATSSGATAVQFPVVFGSDGPNDTSSPFSQTYSWTSGASASGAKSVTASNGSGTSSPSTFTVTPDATAPVTTMSCNSAPCAGPYSSAVTVSLARSDAGGSGVAATYYTTDGSLPTTASTPYAAPFVLSTTATVRFFSVDNVGNQETAGAGVTVTITGGGGGIAFVQQAVASGTAASLPVALPATGTGHALVATIALAAGSSASVLSVTDSASGTWTKGPVGFLTGVNSRVEIWYRLGASSVTSVTVTLSAAKSAAVNVSEWSGVATASAVDASAGANVASSTTVTTPSLATTNATDLVIGAINYPAAASSTLASGSFTGLNDFNSGSGVHGRAAYQITSATGSYQASWTLDIVSGGSGGAILALKAA